MTNEAYPYRSSLRKLPKALEERSKIEREYISPWRVSVTKRRQFVSDIETLSPRGSFSLFFPFWPGIHRSYENIPKNNGSRSVTPLAVSPRTNDPIHPRGLFRGERKTAGPIHPLHAHLPYSLSPLSIANTRQVGHCPWPRFAHFAAGPPHFSLYANNKEKRGRGSFSPGFA